MLDMYHVLSLKFATRFFKLVNEHLKICNVCRERTAISRLIANKLDGGMKTPKQTFRQVHDQIKHENEVSGARNSLELTKRLRNSNSFFFRGGFLGDRREEKQAA
jgi:hypothetical protein